MSKSGPGQRQDGCLIRSQNPEDFVGCRHRNCPAYDECRQRQPKPEPARWVHVYVTEESLELMWGDGKGWWLNHDYRRRPSERYPYRVTVPEPSLDCDMGERWFDPTYITDECEWESLVFGIRRWQPRQASV
ncbi:hypothetical protein ACFL26_02075 [Patescibacteria group bacterium]